MTYDYLQLDKNSAVPLYRQLYLCIRGAVESGHLREGSRLPSVRRLAGDLALSCTTVEAAYQQLCVEGYIRSSPQSGYFVLNARREGPERESAPPVFRRTACAARAVRFRQRLRGYRRHRHQNLAAERSRGSEPAGCARFLRRPSGRTGTARGAFGLQLRCARRRRPPGADCHWRRHTAASFAFLRPDGFGANLRSHGRTGFPAGRAGLCRFRHSRAEAALRQRRHPHGRARAERSASCLRQPFQPCRHGVVHPHEPPDGAC